MEKKKINLVVDVCVPGEYLGNFLNLKTVIIE
jgi:hypothetical protein